MLNQQGEWLLPVDEEGVLTFPPEFIELLGWKEGDLLDFDISENNEVLVTNLTKYGKAEDTDGTPGPQTVC